MKAMKTLPETSVQTQGRRTRPLTGWATLPRPFGEYLLVAPLGDDALGTVYRALHSADERRFMRLRILQSGELSPSAIAAAVERQAERSAASVHDGIVRRAQFGLVNGVPYMAWYETADWTLDRVLGRVRALNSRITVEYALLLAERIVAAMERTSPTVSDGAESRHGLLWPGFVSVSNDAEVRVGGFGLAEAVFPSLQKPRLYRDIAPYVAPEARERRTIAGNSDVYSLGVILLELLTGRRPVVSASVPDLRAGDPLSTEIAAVLERSLAPVGRRYGSVVEMHQSMEKLLVASSPAPSPADLALFLYRLLNPESHGVAPADADSRKPAEDSRFQAAMARIAAERLEARELAPEAFQEGSLRETAAGQLLDEGRFGEARTEFDRAGELFRQATDLCREERARRVKTSLVAEPPGP